jgi:hypothetical protein
MHRKNRDEFQSLLNKLYKHGYEGTNHQGKNGVVRIKSNDPLYEKGKAEYKVKATGIDLRIIGFYDRTNGYLVFNMVIRHEPTASREKQYNVRRSHSRVHY